MACLPRVCVRQTFPVRDVPVARRSECSVREADREPSPFCSQAALEPCSDFDWARGWKHWVAGSAASCLWTLHWLAWGRPLAFAVRGWSQVPEPALATVRVSVQVRVRVRAFEPVPVQVFEQASATVQVLVFEPVPVPVSVSGPAQASASELEQAREQVSGLELVGVRPVLWERCPYPCLCLSREQRCRSARARRQ